MEYNKRSVRRNKNIQPWGPHQLSTWTSAGPCTDHVRGHILRALEQTERNHRLEERGTMKSPASDIQASGIVGNLKVRAARFLPDDTRAENPTLKFTGSSGGATAEWVKRAPPTGALMRRLLNSPSVELGNGTMFVGRLLRNPTQKNFLPNRKQKQRDLEEGWITWSYHLNLPFFFSHASTLFFFFFWWTQHCWLTAAAAAP